MNANVESVADQVVRMARPGGVVLVDSEFFSPLIEVLRARAGKMDFSVRTVHFDDLVGLLKQALATPIPAVACCPEGATQAQCDCLRKAHMLLEQLGISIIETHEELAAATASEPTRFLPKAAISVPEVVAA